ncbi:hypothetical protein GGI21_004100, partial [Coemansia aciculifera]
MSSTSSISEILSSSSSSTATSVVPKNPFDEDTFFTDWVTPGLVAGLLVGLVFVALISVGVSWMASIQTPKTMPSTKQKKYMASIDTPTIVDVDSFAKFIFAHETVLVIGLEDADAIARVKARSIMSRLNVAYCFANFSMYDLTTDILFTTEEEYNFKYAYCVDCMPETCPEATLDI